MKYRRLLHRLAKLIPDPRPVTIRVRWIDSSDRSKLPDSSDRLKPPGYSDPLAPKQSGTPK